MSINYHTPNVLQEELRKSRNRRKRRSHQIRDLQRRIKDVRRAIEAGMTMESVRKNRVQINTYLDRIGELNKRNDQDYEREDLMGLALIGLNHLNKR